MKKKGFTLIEMLGVITIIAIIAGISIVSINSIIARNNEKTWSLTKANIEKSAETYALEQNLSFANSDEVGNYAIVTIKDLYEAGYLKKGLYNPINRQTIESTDDIIIKVYQVGINFSAVYQEE